MLDSAISKVICLYSLNYWYFVTARCLRTDFSGLDLLIAIYDFIKTHYLRRLMITGSLPADVLWVCFCSTRIPTHCLALSLILI